MWLWQTFAPGSGRPGRYRQRSKSGYGQQRAASITCPSCLASSLRASAIAASAEKYCPSRVRLRPRRRWQSAGCRSRRSLRRLARRL